MLKTLENTTEAIHCEQESAKAADSLLALTIGVILCGIAVRFWWAFLGLIINPWCWDSRTASRT
jgi:hypothetical protein